ncbi:putative pectate lyase 3 [Raphanus sativus]|nr:putative pectate lyase 3 [Raphanus sativus]
MTKRDIDQWLPNPSTLTPHFRANVDVFDNYWTQGDALKQTIASYDPNPLNATDHLSYHVALAADATESINSARRELSKVRNGRKMRSLQVTNDPIDKCWRCHGDWEKNRKKLAGCVLGFGRRTTGGKDGLSTSSTMPLMMILSNL